MNTGTEDDALAELGPLALQAPAPKSLQPKTLQGQVLFTIPVDRDFGAFADALLALTTVDYVHVLLASVALEGDDALGAIERAAAAVERAEFATALRLWRAVGGSTTPDAALGFRALGKRGGKGHTFSSDDAKRAAASGLAAATGLRRSTKDFDFDVVAQVHRARCWIGLRLNRKPLAVRAAAAPKVAAAVPWPAPAPPPPPAAPTPRRRPDAAAPPAAVADGDDAPVLLSGWMAARLAELGLERPRDARDAVAPLWEVPYAEQRASKQSEIHGVARAIAADLAAPPRRRGGRGGAEAGTATGGGVRAAKARRPIGGAQQGGAARRSRPRRRGVLRLPARRRPLGGGAGGGWRRRRAVCGGVDGGGGGRDGAGNG